MKWESTNWLIEEGKNNINNNNTKWTIEENKRFENALAIYDKETPDRWHKVASMIPGKTVNDVMKQYRELEVDVNNIEAGLVPIPGYDPIISTNASPFTLNWSSNGNISNNNSCFDSFKHPYVATHTGKRSSSGRLADQERKKGVPWTEEEHKLFLMGLKKYGKGDWRNISRNFVVTRTPTQVASHAQKYFIRQLSGGKDKRRASIHDITTVNVNEIRTPSPDSKTQSSPDHSMALSQQSNGGSMTRTHFQWNQPNSGAMGFNSTHGNLFMSSPYGINSYGYKMQGSYISPQSIPFQMQSAQHYPHG